MDYEESLKLAKRFLKNKLVDFPFFIQVFPQIFLHVLIVIRLCCEETVHSNLCLCGSANRSSGLNKAYIIILIFIILFIITCIIIIFETIIIIIIVKCIDWIRFPVTKTRQGRFFSNFRGFPVKENDELV